jgi:hypothetical protein
LNLITRMRQLILIIIFFLSVPVVYAQTSFSGRVIEDKTRILLPGIKVENITSHINTNTDYGGKFTIKAKVGDLIRFSGLNYLPDTVYLTTLSAQEISLNLQQNQLNEVNVKGAEANKNSFGVIKPITPFGGSVVRYQTDANLNPTGGLKFNVFDSQKDARKREHSRQLEVDGQRQQEISKVFSPKSLQGYLPISGQELSNFIILYRPDIATYYSGSFNLAMYLNNCYKKFLEIPIEKRQSATAFQLNKE